MSDNFMNIGISFGIIISTVVIAFVVSRFIKRLITRSSKVIKNDPTNYLFLRHALTAIIYTIGFSAAVYAVPSMRTLASSLLAGAGILAVAVGFASKHVLSNIISGFFIVIFKPFRVHDRLTVRGMTGVVEDITLRHTVIRDFENQRILIPNELISDEIIINSDFAEEEICTRIDIRIGFDSNLDLAKKIIAEVIENHPLHKDIRTKEQRSENAPVVPVRVLAIEEYALNLRAWVWTENASQGFVLKCDVLETLKKQFDKVGIEIPYPHQMIIKKHEAQ